MPQASYEDVLMMIEDEDVENVIKNFAFIVYY